MAAMESAVLVSCFSLNLKLFGELLYIYKGRFHEKKVAVLLDFVQMRGGGPCQNFVTFS